MKGSQNSVFDALQRAGPFLDENAEELKGVDFTAARKRLEEVVTSFTSHAFDQDVGERGARGETAKQQQLRIKLRSELMEPIAFIARRNLRTTPEFKALRMPKQSVRGQAFNASASGMAQAATIHKDTLVAHGLQSTFLDDLKAGVDALETSQAAREKNRVQRVGATKGLLVEEKNGVTVLTVLDALVRQALAGKNESLLRKWESVRLIRRTTANTSVAPTTSQATPAPTSTPVGSSTSSSPAPASVPASTSTPVATAA